MRSYICLGVCVVGVVAAAASAAEISLVPVDFPGGSPLINNGQTVEFEIFIDGIAAPPLLRYYQITLEIVPGPGATGVLELADPCTTEPPAPCPNQWPNNKSVFIGSLIEDGGGEWHVEERPDWVFADVEDPVIPAADIRLLMLGPTLLFPPFDVVEVLSPRYAGTYIFKASDDAEGQFDVRFMLTYPDTGDPVTWLKDPVNLYIPFTLDPPSVTVTVQQVAANDSCQNSEPISEGRTLFSNENTTTDGPTLPLACDEGWGRSFEQDIWFDHVATCSGLLTVSTCDDADFNTRLAVYGDGSPVCLCPSDNTFFLECSDDAPGCASGTSEVTLSVTQGECLTIRVGGRSTAEGIGHNHPPQFVNGGEFYPPTPRLPGAVMNGLGGTADDQPFMGDGIYHVSEYWTPMVSYTVWLMALLERS